VNSRVLGEPWFKHFEPAKIDPYIEAVHKVAEQAGELKAIDQYGADGYKGGVALSVRKP
jgi:hypothetical protein